MIKSNKEMKRVLVYTSGSQKNNFQEFLHSINFYFYTTKSKLECSWESGIRHFDTHIWPGSDCVFYLLVSSEHVDVLLRKIKAFRMTLPENVVMAAFVTPIEDFIYNMNTADIEPDEKIEENINWLDI